MTSLLKILTSTKFSLIWTSTWFVVSVLITVRTCDIEWIGSAGAMITLAGILLTTRGLLLTTVEAGIAKETINSFYYAQNSGDPEAEKKYQDIKNEAMLNVKSSQSGFWFLIVGTLIWAYGPRIYESLF